MTVSIYAHIKDEDTITRTAIVELVKVVPGAKLETVYLSKKHTRDILELVRIDPMDAIGGFESEAIIPGVKFRPHDGTTQLLFKKDING